MQPRSQTQYLSQFQQYLITQNYENNPYAFDEEGYCFGMCLSRAALRAIGQIDWWRLINFLAFDWDGKIESLDQKYRLDNEEKNEINIVSLKDIFETIINFVVYNHAHHKYTRNVRQHRFLDVGGPFQVIDKDEVLTIKHNFKIAGFFTIFDLIQVLEDQPTKETIKNNICLVHSGDHTCELNIKNGKWSFFNPNDESGDDQYFDSTNELVNAIVDSLGQSISIELACIHPCNIQPFPYYFNTLLFHYPESLAHAEGLHSISFSSSELAVKLITNLHRKNKFNYLDINKPDTTGDTLFFYAACNNNVDLMKYLILMGASPYCEIDDGHPCVIAARYGEISTVRFFLRDIHPNDYILLHKTLEAGIDCNHKNIVDLCIEEIRLRYPINQALLQTPGVQNQISVTVNPATFFMTPALRLPREREITNDINKNKDHTTVNKKRKFENEPFYTGNCQPIVKKARIERVI